MKNLDELNRSKKSYFKEITLIFIICIGVVIFAMGIVRGRCISKGYALSNMAEEIERRKIRIDRYEASRSNMISKEILFPLAADKGFIFMEEGKTFNVQR